MNPALLNYLQANQQNQDQMGLLGNVAEGQVPNPGQLHEILH